MANVKAPSFGAFAFAASLSVQREAKAFFLMVSREE